MMQAWREDMAPPRRPGRGRNIEEIARGALGKAKPWTVRELRMEQINITSGTINFMHGCGLLRKRGIKKEANGYSTLWDLTTKGKKAANRW